MNATRSPVLQAHCHSTGRQHFMKVKCKTNLHGSVPEGIGQKLLTIACSDSDKQQVVGDDIARIQVQSVLTAPDESPHAA